MHCVRCITIDLVSAIWYWNVVDYRGRGSRKSLFDRWNKSLHLWHIGIPRNSKGLVEATYVWLSRLSIYVSGQETQNSMTYEQNIYIRNTLQMHNDMIHIYLLATYGYFQRQMFAKYFNFKSQIQLKSIQTVNVVIHTYIHTHVHTHTHTHITYIHAYLLWDLALHGVHWELT